MFGYCILHFMAYSVVLMITWIRELCHVSIVYRIMEVVSFSECMLELYRPAENKLIVAYVGTRANC